jgi:alpha-D-xyloside xylohydrolase
MKNEDKMKNISRRNFLGGVIGAGVSLSAMNDSLSEPMKAKPEGALPQMKKASPLVHKLEKIAPGVWRVRYGEPEQFTPLHFRTASMQDKALEQLPPVTKPPLNIADIEARAESGHFMLEIPLDKEERLYGFGLNTAIFDMMNRRCYIVPSDGPESATNASHAPVPFYVSNRGYGVYVDTARFASFYTGNVDPVKDASSSVGNKAIATSTEELYKPQKPEGKTLMVDIPAARGVDIYLFAGPALNDAVRRYNLFSGGGSVPPLWGLGIVYRGMGSFSAQDSLDLAKQLRDDHLPCDVWGIEPGWQTRTYSSSFVWDKGRFPDPDAFIRSLHEMGYRLNVWEHAFTNPVSPMYKSLLPWSGDFRVWGGLVPDFASSKARKIFTDYHEKILISKGVDGFKLDECDYQPFTQQPWSFPEASAFPSGQDGEQMHSMFGELYQQTLLQPYTRRKLRTWGLVRNSHALAAPLPYTVYSDSYDHKDYVRGLAKEGFCGLLWTPEVRDAGSVEELYRRIETVIFSPCAMINCWYMKLPPWRQINKDKANNGEMMPDHEHVTDVVRLLFELRMSLIPYLYSAFNEYHLNGTPPVRAMVMDWPEDADTALIDDQFLFGPSLLVAPLFAGNSSRSVYLPAGEWYDFWTQEKIAGGRKVDITKSFDQIPIFIKANSLLPVAKPVEHIDDDTCFDITVHVFGNQPASFTLYEDDGVSTDYEQGKQNRMELKWDGGSGSAIRSGKYKGKARYNIVGWKSES